MAYDLHIERAEKPIGLSEWRIAVEATEGVRLFAPPAHTDTNPKAGEVISIGAREGDAEVFFPETGEWRWVFRWRGGSAAFTAPFAPYETSHPVWRAAVGLATRLGAVIRDLTTEQSQRLEGSEISNTEGEIELRADEPFGQPVPLPIDGVLDLHTVQPREVKDVLLAYLDACQERGIGEVRIIHGKGMGNLQRTVHSILQKHPAVVSFTLASQLYGGSGATIAKLRTV